MLLSAVLVTACSKRAPPAPPTITAYVPQSATDRVVVPMLNAAANHHWALSIRTDSSAPGEVDLIVIDRGGQLAAHPRPDSPAAAQAREIAAAIHLPLE